MRRKGFIFTLDALLSVLLVMVFVTSVIVVSDNVGIYSTYMREQNKYIAEDTLTILRKVSLKDLVPQQTLTQWERDEILDTTFVSRDMSPLEIVATYWTIDPIYPEFNLKHKAEIILGYLLNSTLKGYNYELLINNYTSSYLRNVEGNYSKALEVSPATLVLSGYIFNQTPRGYVARAYLTKLRAKETTYTYFGSSAFAYAPSSQDYTIIRYTIPNEEENELPYDVNITKIKWFAQPRWFSPSSYMRLFIDGEAVECGQFRDDTFVEYSIWEVLEDSNPSDPQTCNILEILKRHNDLRRHTFEVWVYNPGGSSYTGGVHPNVFITLTYQTSQLSTFNYPQTFHFDEIETKHPFQVENAIFIGGNLSSLYVQVQIINASKVSEPNYPKLYLTYLDRQISVGGGTYIGNDTYVWDNQTIFTALQNGGIYIGNLSKTYLWVAVTFGMDYQEPPYGDSTSYAYKLKLNYDNSYIRAVYAPETAKTLYSIDITEEITKDDVILSNYERTDYSVPFYTMLTWRYTLPLNVTPIWAKLHIVRLHRVDTTPPELDPDEDQKISISPGVNNWTVLYCHSARALVCNPNRPFADPAFTRWGIVNMMRNNTGEPVVRALVPGENYIKVETGDDYVISRDFTTGEFTYLLDAYAPYGDIKPYLLQGYPEVQAYNLTYKYGSGSLGSIFVGDIKAIENGKYMNLTVAQLNPQDYAVDDAIIRLFQKLGGDGWDTPILIELKDTKISFASLKGIPRSIESITITLRVWREN